MYPILFSIGRVNIYTHGLMMVLGALVGGAIIFYLARHEKYRTDFLFDLLIYSFLSGLVGARILYLILYHNQFASLEEMSFIWYGGLVSFGGMIGGLTISYLILKAKKENILKWFDIGIIGMLVGWAIGRIGCFLNNDSVGILSSVKIAIWGRIPTQIFEATWTIILSIILYLIYRTKNNFKLPDGAIFFLGICGYTVGRFIIDFWRDDAVQFLWLKAGQIGSIIVFIISFSLLIKLIKNRKEAQWS